MTTERDPQTRTVLSWLREDAHENAERVLLRALDEVDTTAQRPSRWPARRTPTMNPAYKFALVAATVLVVAIVGLNTFLRNDGSGVPLVPTPTAVPSAAGPPLLPAGPLAAGTYRTEPFSGSGSRLQVTLTVPTGWHGFPPNAVVPDAMTEPPGGAVALLQVSQLYKDPCNKNDTPLVSTGTTVDDLVRALGDVQSSYTVGTAVDVTVGGYSGKRLDLLVPSGSNFSSCDELAYWIWEPGPYAQGPANRWHIWILDVAGTRVVILGHDFPTTPAPVQAQLRDIVASMVFEP